MSDDWAVCGVIIEGFIRLSSKNLLMLLLKTEFLSVLWLLGQ